MQKLLIELKNISGDRYRPNGMSYSIGNYRAVNNFDENTCPSGGFSNC